VLQACAVPKAVWQTSNRNASSHPILQDEYGALRANPAAAIQIATIWAKARGAVCFFDAGDVQANGFQVVEDDHPGQTFTETGASYMGFAVSALLATALPPKPSMASR